MNKLWIFALWLLMSAFVMAQENTETPIKSSEEQAEIVESIVVTGEKMGRRLEETASSVSVMTAQDIEESSVKDLYEVVERMANVGQSYGELGFNIRGIDQRGFGGSSNAMLSVYVDGGILNNVETFFGPFSMWDMEQVEILRGPQSTTQGRNAAAGAIVLRSQRPTNDWDLKFRALGGEQDTRQYAAAFGGPIIEDVLTFRVSAERLEHDGYLVNTFLETDADAHESELYRLKLSYTPKNLDNLNILLSVTDSDSFGGEDSTSAMRGFERTVSYDVQGFEGVDMQIYSLVTNYQITSAWSATFELAATESEHLRLEDIDNTPLNLGALDVFDENEDRTQELRISYQGDRIRGFFGVYHADTDTNGDFDVTIPLAFLDPSLPADIFVSRQSLNENVVENSAFFGEVDFELNDRWTLTAGLRYDREDRSILLRNQTQAVDPLPPPLDQLLAPFFGSDDNFSETDIDALLPKLAITHKVNDRVTTGGSIQRAYRSGGSGNSLSGFNFFFDAEFLLNYEWFLRARSEDNRWGLNTNVFYVDWEDQQVSVPAPTDLPNDFITVNAGKSRLQGFELEGAVEVATGIELFASVGHSDTEYVDFVQNGVDFAGRQFPFAAEWTGSAGVSYRDLKGFYGTLIGTFTDDRFSQVPISVEEEPLVTVDSHTLVNLKFGWENENWAMGLDVRNLLDEDYFTSYNLSTDFARLGAPRIISVFVDYKF